jgi:hypothetical protein
LASSSGDKTVRLWDVRSGSLLRSLEGHSSGVDTVAFAGEGMTLASGSADNTIRLWDAKSGRLLRILEGHSNWVNAVAFTRDGMTLASGSEDKTIRLWDLQSGRCVAIFSGILKGAMTVTREAYFLTSGDVDIRPSLSLYIDTPGESYARLYLPVGGLREVLENPERVAAVLIHHQIPPDQLRTDLAAAGLGGGALWDGERRILPTEERAAESVTTAGPSSSSFRPGAGFDETTTLVGRQPKVEEIQALVQGRCPSVIIGPRRSGKTWLLRYLERQLSTVSSVYYVSLEGKTLVTADDLAQALAPELVGDGKRTPSQRFRSLWEKGNRPIFLLDEIAHLHKADGTLFPWLRALGQEFAGLILAGSPLDFITVVRRAAEIAPGSSFGNDITPVVLGPIGEEEAERFLVETSGQQIPLSTARRVIEMCGAWPFYLQVMGHALSERVRIGDRRPLHDPHELRNIYEQRLLVERNAAFESRWAELPTEVRSFLLKHYMERPEFLRLPQAERVRLLDAGLCTATGIWLADPPFFDWIRHHRSLLDAEKKDPQ